jgi:hypothetical protein
MRVSRRKKQQNRRKHASNLHYEHDRIAHHLRGIQFKQRIYDGSSNYRSAEKGAGFSLAGHRLIAL